MSEGRQYSIGAVANHTGLSTHTLRKWEDRYNAIAPSRSQGGDRRYSDDDLERLLKLRELVNRGASIGSIGHLQTAEIEKLLKDLPEARTPSQNLSIVVLDHSGERTVMDGAARMTGVDIVGHGNDAAELANVEADALLWELPVIGRDTTRDLMAVRTESGQQNVAVIYKYGTIADAERLSDQNTLVISRPVNFYELARSLRSITRTVMTPRLALSAPPHRFSRGQLAAIANISNSVACECPRHIARLVMDLTDFEAYSEECENLQPQDARVHALLRRTSATARSLFESALIEVAEADGLQLPAKTQ